MKDKHLHIVALNIPFPADYGGVIDIYYKIKSLSEKGLKIHLHCFEYGRAKASILNKFCDSVDYYPRKMKWQNLFSKTPFIVKSRTSEKLLQNLQKFHAPILFEGLHSCAYLKNPLLQNQKQFVRSHNIEANYYKALAKSETRLLNKLYLFTEYFKIKTYESKLKEAKGIFSISLKDHEYFSIIGTSHYIKAFHSDTEITSQEGIGEYAIYHGNLSVAENEDAALFLIQKVFSKLDYPLVITGYAPSKKLRRIAKSHNHIRIVENPEDLILERMLKNAHIQVLPTLQDTGIKLKLLKSLYQGRHCLVNGKMVNKTGLESLCHIVEKPNEWIEKIKELEILSFSSKEIQARKDLMLEEFNTKTEANKIIKIIFPQD